MEWEHWTWCCIERELIWKEVSTTKYLMTYSVIIPTICMIILYKIGDLDGWKHISFAKSWKFRPGPSKNLPKTGGLNGDFPLAKNAASGLHPNDGSDDVSDHLYSIETLGGSIHWYCHASHAEFLWVSRRISKKYRNPGKLKSRSPRKVYWIPRGKACKRLPSTILWLGELLSFGGGCFFLQYSGKN